MHLLINENFYSTNPLKSSFFAHVGFRRFTGPGAPGHSPCGIPASTGVFGESSSIGADVTATAGVRAGDIFMGDPGGLSNAVSSAEVGSLGYTLKPDISNNRLIDSYNQHFYIDPFKQNFFSIFLLLLSLSKESNNKNQSSLNISFS